MEANLNSTPGEKIKLTLQRSGNVLQLTFPKNASSLQNSLAAQLVYQHRRHLQAFEIRQRRRELGYGAFIPPVEITPRSLCEIKDDRLLCPAGLKSKVLRFLASNGVEYSYEDLRKKKLPPADYTPIAKLGLELRYRQDEVLAVIDAAEGGVIASPTGYGKTFIATLVALVYPRSKIVFVSPGLDLLRSTYDRVRKYVPDIGRIGAGYYEPKARVLMCSADSLHKAPLGEASMIIYDEVHTAATESRSNALCAQYTDAKMIGFSASVNVRADGADAIVEAIFGPVLTSITYAEAAQAGIVAQIQAQPISVPQTPDSPRLFGDTYQKKRDGYWCNHQRNDTIARVVGAVPGMLGKDDPQILIMCETVEHIFELKSLLPDFEVVYANLEDATRNKLEARGVHIGQVVTPQMRADILDRFQRGTLRRVIANHCWKQGIDPVHLNCFIRADGGTSEINNIQLPGRLSRITEGKAEGFLVDFADEFDDWARRRARVRLSSYQKSGFNILPTIKV